MDVLVGCVLEHWLIEGRGGKRGIVKIISEFLYDQEIPQSQTAVNSVEP